RFYGLATRSLAAALAIDPGQKGARALLADLFYERALLAQRDHQIKRRDELLDNMAIYDYNSERAHRWNAHGRLEVATSPAGAEVVLEQLEETSRRRKVGERLIGKTPLVDVDVPRGSFVLRINSPGRAEVRYPVLVEAGDRLALNIYLPSANEIPSGFVYIPPGKFLFGSQEEGLRKAFFRTSPLHPVKTEAYFIKQTETT